MICSRTAAHHGKGIVKMNLRSASSSHPILPSPTTLRDLERPEFDREPQLPPRDCLPRKNVSSPGRHQSEHQVWSLPVEGLSTALSEVALSMHRQFETVLLCCRSSRPLRGACKEKRFCFQACVQRHSEVWMQTVCQQQAVWGLQERSFWSDTQTRL